MSTAFADCIRASINGAAVSKRTTRQVLKVGTNEKVGKTGGTWSRPVGTTCPADCPFLCGVLPDGSAMPKRHRCYKQRIDARRPNVRDAAARNLDVDTAWAVSLRDDLLKPRVRVARPHVGGDFLREGRVDRRYLAHVLWAVSEAKRVRPELELWVYTHAWRELTPYLPILQRYFACYASVHCEADACAAANAGWLLAIDGGASDVNAAGEGGFRNRWGFRTLLCPEQVKGRGNMTCDKCRYCSRGRGNVEFLRH